MRTTPCRTIQCSEAVLGPVIAGLLSLLLAISGAMAQATCCPEVPGFQWVQLPDLVTPGLDINASQGYEVADNFLCTTPGPITDIRIWGSWLSDIVDTNAHYGLGIYSDVPVGTNNNF